MTGGATLARLLNRRSLTFLCFMGTKKTDWNKLFHIQGKTLIGLTEAKLILSMVHMFLEMGGKIHPSTEAQCQD